MNAILICVDAVTMQEEIRLVDCPILFGRSYEADVRLDDTWTSRLHCRIDKIDGEWVVRDLSSSNGTLVNGERIEQATLTPGDTLTVGISTFELRNAPVAYASGSTQPLFGY